MINGPSPPRKSDGILRQGIPVKYAWVHTHQPAYPIAIACVVLGISISGYHGHRKRRRQSTYTLPTNTSPRISRDRVMA